MHDLTSDLPQNSYIQPLVPICKRLGVTFGRHKACSKTESVFKSIGGY